MIQQKGFQAEAWALHETELDLDRLAQTESVFALSNGHIGLRGNLDEGEPFGLQGTYLSGFYELYDLPYAEVGYGNPEAGQQIVNMTDGKIIRLLVEDEPFDLRYGELRSHERVLDLRAGVLRRSVEWASPTGRVVRIRSTRLVSFTQRAVAAICYEVEPVDEATRVVVQSDLVANEPVPAPDNDPRASIGPSSPLHREFGAASGNGAVLVHSTVASGLRAAAAMDHIVEGPEGTEASSEQFQDMARVVATADLKSGEVLRVIKFLSYGWSSVRSTPALLDQARAGLAEAQHTTWDGLLEEQRAYLDTFWDRADVEIEGDAELQLAVRFGLFHALQATARAEQRGIAAKGLTGHGYDGHTFWDTEMFVLPVMTYTAPHAAGDALRWRHRTLDLAQERAKELGLKGATFPWRTIRGQECSGYWPAGTAAFHINAAVANAVERYLEAQEDEQFARDVGVELLVETARMWRFLGHHDAEGRFRIDGVTGPDEYSALADNNVYTNLMAQQNLRAAANAVERRRQVAAKLGVDAEESASWRDAADAMMIVYDENLGVHPQAERFTDHQRWDFEATRPDQYPLLLHFHYFDLYRKQVVKQADLVLAMHWRGDAFTDDEKARNFAYYEALTVRDSSLSACTQAVIAAEAGHLELAYDYLAEAALMDLDDLEHNTRDGLHIASLAGGWLAAVAGFGGFRDYGGTFSFAPRLPQALTRLTFRLCCRGRRLLVEVQPGQATYTLLDGSSLDLVHHGKKTRVNPGHPLKRPIPPPPKRETPTQPPGRSPARRQPAP